MVDVQLFKLTSFKKYVRRRPSGQIDELTEKGWRPAPHMAAHVKDMKPVSEVDEEQARMRQLLIDTAIDDPARTLSAGQLRRERLKEWMVPPLQYGAPRFSGQTSRRNAAESSYGDELPPLRDAAVRAALIEQARDGYERQGNRVEGTERRAGLYQGSAAISGGLVITGTGLISGKDAVSGGPLLGAVAAALIVVSVLLLISGARAHQAAVRTFGWARPNIRRKVIDRAKLGELADVEQSLLCALLLAQDRGQVIAEWKVERLKQATRYFIGAVLASVVLSVVLVVSTLL
jgi:hypothetical protein